MDDSPTTGSVSSTVAEKQRLAKASLAFNCKNATFRRMFPEYVEKYNQQLVPEQKSPPELLQTDNSSSEPEKLGNSSVRDMKNVDTPKDMPKKRKQTFPTWMMLLLVSIFGVVMALPLLQL